MPIQTIQVQSVNSTVNELPEKPCNIKQQSQNWLVQGIGYMMFA